MRVCKKERKYTWQKNARISCSRNDCKYTWEKPHVYRVIILKQMADHMWQSGSNLTPVSSLLRIIWRLFADLEKISRSSAYKRQFIYLSLSIMSVELAVFRSLRNFGWSLREKIKRVGDNRQPCFTPAWQVKDSVNLLPNLTADLSFEFMDIKRSRKLSLDTFFSQFVE